VWCDAVGVAVHTQHWMIDGGHALCDESVWRVLHDQGITDNLACTPIDCLVYAAEQLAISIADA
jgi:hypothetical protein